MASLLDDADLANAARQIRELYALRMRLLLETDRRVRVGRLTPGRSLAGISWTLTPSTFVRLLQRGDGANANV